MANNIVPSTAAFTTSNMKPDPDEVISALLQQKMADNTGYLYNITTNLALGAVIHDNFLNVTASTNTIPSNDSYGGGLSFIKTSGLNTLHGTIYTYITHNVVLFTSGTASGTFNVLLNSADGVTNISTIFSHKTAVMYNFGDSVLIGTGITYDISSLTNGSMYTIVPYGTIRDEGDQVSGQTYSMTIRNVSFLART